MTAATVHARRWVILSVLCLALFSATLDTTVLNVALPSVARDLDLSATQVEWVADAYSLAFAALLLTAGSLSDRMGRKRGLLVGLAVFAVASLLSAMATSAVELIVLRALTGVGGAFLMPSTLSILVQVFQAEERTKAIGIWGGVSAIGIAAGPVLGGLLVAGTWWGAAFLVAVPITVAAFAASVALVPESRNLAAPRLDIVGALLAAAGMSALVWGLIQAPAAGWLAPPTLIPLSAAAAVAVVFVVWERRAPHPLVDLRLLRDRGFVGANLAGSSVMFLLMGASFLLTQYPQFVAGLDPVAASLCTLPLAAGVGLMSAVVGRLAARLGEGRAIALGLSVMALGFAVMASFVADRGVLPALVGTFALGLGVGTVVAPASAALMRSLPREQAGIASAMNDTAQEAGSALGVAVLGSLLVTLLQARMPGAVSLADAFAASPVAAAAAFSDALGAVFWVAAAVAIAAAGVCARVFGLRRPATPARAATATGRLEA